MALDGGDDPLDGDALEAALRMWGERSARLRVVVGVPFVVAGLASAGIVSDFILGVFQGEGVRVEGGAIAVAAAGPAGLTLVAVIWAGLVTARALVRVRSPRWIEELAARRGVDAARLRALSEIFR